MKTPTDYDLTVLVDAAAEGSTNSRANLTGSNRWDELDGRQKNLIREAALPFIYHGMKALEGLDYKKPRTITTPAEIDALPKDTLFTSQYGQGLVMHPDFIGDKEFAPNVLPAVVYYEPTP